MDPDGDATHDHPSPGPSRKRQRTGEHEEDDDKQSSVASDTPPVRDPDYYREDGDCVFVVENVLFKVHKYILTRDDSAFGNMFSLPVGNDAENHVSDGSSDDSAIRLFDCPDQFRALLRALLMMPHEAEAMTASLDNLEDLLFLSEIANKYHFASTTSWAVNSVYKLVTRPDPVDPVAGNPYRGLVARNAPTNPLPSQIAPPAPVPQGYYPAPPLLQNHPNFLHQPFIFQPGPAGVHAPNGQPLYQPMPQSARAIHFNRNAPRTCYLDECSDDVLAHILDVAVLCSHEDLKNRTVKTWTTRLKEENDLDLHVALEVANKHGLRVLQGAIYYSKLLSMDSLASLGSGATPFVDDHMCEHHIGRLLQGSWSLSRYWAQLRIAPPALGPSQFCPAGKHAATCQPSWVAMWATTWAEASKTRTTSDVNGALNLMRRIIFRRLSGELGIAACCRKNALDVVDRVLEGFNENLADHFLCT